MTHGRRVRALMCGLGVAVTGVALASVSGVGAHAFVSRSEPRSGATVAEPVTRVRIWFDGPIEPMFARVSVEDRDKRRVDDGEGRVNPSDPRLLEVGLLPLSPGRYRVWWSVIARDGHQREGTFSFLLK